MENKMTDNEIIKALECCGYDYYKCQDCPLREIERIKCLSKMALNAIDLINRLHGRIASCVNGIVDRENKIRELKDTVEIAKVEIEKQDKEIKRLHNILYSYALQYGTVTDQSKKIEQIKAEAIKEFAEKLTYTMSEELATDCWLWQVEDCVDNLVKEMVGEE